MIFIQGHCLIWRSTVMLIQTHWNLNAPYAANYLEVKTICLIILRDFIFLKVLATAVHIAQLYLILGLVFANIKRDTMQMCICLRVAPDYAADLSVPILDRGRNAKEREIGSSTMYTGTVQCTYICRLNYIKVIYHANGAFDK